MRDPSLSRRARGGGIAIPPTYGWFVRQGTNVVLTDRRGNNHNLEYVSILQGTFGWDSEGFTKFPRPRVVDAEGKLLIEGDRVMIDYLDGNVKRPVVRGGIRSTRAIDFLGYNYKSEGATSNRLALRVEQRDERGNLLGEVEFEIGRNDLGKAELRASERIELVVVDRLGEKDTGEELLRIRIREDGVDIVRGQTDSTDQVILGREFLTELKIALTEIAAGLTAIPSSAAAVNVFIAKITAALTPDISSGQPGGAPFLSTVLRTE